MKKIMIIDDEVEFCKVLTEGLKELGYQAFYATNGMDGLQMIEKESPQLLLLDIHMPGMDGMDVIRLIHDRFPNIIIIVISGVTNPAIRKKVIEMGACEYLTKPVNLDGLVRNCIKPLLGG